MDLLTDPRLIAANRNTIETKACKMVIVNSTVCWTVGPLIDSGILRMVCCRNIFKGLSRGTLVRVINNPDTLDYRVPSVRPQSGKAVPSMEWKRHLVILYGPALNQMRRGRRRRGRKNTNMWPCQGKLQMNRLIKQRFWELNYKYRRVLVLYYPRAQLLAGYAYIILLHYLYIYIRITIISVYIRI